MRISKFYSRIIPVFSVVLVILITAAVFVSRPPVVVVTEPEFSMLYGTARALIKQAGLSVMYFRPVIRVQVNISAGPEIVAAAINSASKRPCFVVLPGFFGSAYSNYSEEKPDVPLLILAGRDTSNRQRSGANFPVYISTDTGADLYRAGICAASLAGKDGKVMVIQDQYLNAALKKQFENGLAAGGSGAIPQYMDAAADFSSAKDVSCAVAIGSPARFFDQNPKTPVILFSWLDPDITPSSVKLVFDDSPWAIAAGILQIMDWKSGVLSMETLTGVNNTIQSELVVPFGRNSEDYMFYDKIAGTNSGVGKNGGNL
ncbi:MAG: hypothetical protein FWF22_04765 [Treponema sp.]|nr:hypothetical protein [Treponema sp.]